MKTNFGPQTAGARHRRLGFTLVELIIVIVIILLISILVLPSVLGALNDRKYSDAANTIQAVFIGARDRAVQSGNVVGVRLIRDDTDPFDVSQFVYVTVPEPFSVGRVEASVASATTGTVTPVGTVDPHFEQVDPGKNATNAYDDVPRVVPGVSSIRFDSSGRLYSIRAVNAGSPATLTIAPAPLAISPSPATHQYQIFGAPVPLAQADAIPLPQGMVVDVRGAPVVYPTPYSASQILNIPRSRGIPNAVPPVFSGPDGSFNTGDDIHWLGSDKLLGTADDQPSATWPAMDILFAPNGQVTGTAAAQPLIHFWVGERGDKGPDPTAARGADNTVGTNDDVGPNRRRMLLTLNTRTGTMQVLHQVTAASLDNWPPTTGQETYREIYDPAERLLGVSVLP